MDLARVIGTVVATQRDPAFAHMQLLVVQPVNEKLESVGKALVAVDALNVRRNDIVWLVQSGDATDAWFGDGAIPTDCAIGGLVEHLPR